jgi:molybdate transport system substrate-binding protein
VQTFLRSALVAVMAISLTASVPRAETRNCQYNESLFPPWQKGANNDALIRGQEFTVPGVDDLPDFHGDLTDPKLVLYVGGNYFFAMAPLVKAFEEAHPEYKGRIFWETIPPGLLVKQIKSGGVITVGNMTFGIKADAYFAGLKKVKDLISDGTLAPPAVPYVTNTLTIMVPKGNPAKLHSLSDLGRPEIRLAMPNPAFEGIARQIKLSLGKVGGANLVKLVYETKVSDGSTILTHIHHRQTPLFLMLGCAQAGVTWQSEAVFQEQIGNPITHVDIPPQDNTSAIYAGALVNGAPHPDAGRMWLKFIRSRQALTIFESYGFKPYNADRTTSQ